MMRFVHTSVAILCATLSLAAHANLSQPADSVAQLIDQLETNAAFDKSERPSLALSHLQTEPSTLSHAATSSRENLQAWLQVFPLPQDAHRVSSTFGARVMGGRSEQHQGLDLAAPTGTPVYATGAGLVTKAGWGTGYGQYVEINHGNGYLTRYGHASRLHVQVGDRVTAGQQIANVGCTGRCTGPHLHYEVVKDGQRRNPASYLALLP